MIDERVNRDVSQAAIGDFNVLQSSRRQILENREETIVVLGRLAVLRIFDNLVAYLAREGYSFSQYAMTTSSLYRDDVEILADQLEAQIGETFRAYILIRVK